LPINAARREVFTPLSPELKSITHDCINVNRADLDGKPPAVASLVSQKFILICGPNEHEAPGERGRKFLVLWNPVFMRSGDKRLDRLEIFGIQTTQFADFPHQSTAHQPRQVNVTLLQTHLGEEFRPRRDCGNGTGLSKPLRTHQNRSHVSLDARFHHPPRKCAPEIASNSANIWVVLRAQVVDEELLNSRGAVPRQRCQPLNRRIEPVFTRHKVHNIANQLA
jgi:hypothetical protein